MDNSLLHVGAYEQELYQSTTQYWPLQPTAPEAMEVTSQFSSPPGLIVQSPPGMQSLRSSRLAGLMPKTPCSWHGQGNGLSKPRGMTSATGDEIMGSLHTHNAHLKSLGHCDLFICSEQLEIFIDWHKDQVNFLSSSHQPNESHPGHHIWSGLECRQCNAAVYVQMCSNKGQAECDLKAFLKKG